MVTVTVVLSSDKYDSGVTTIVDDAGCGEWAWGLRGEIDGRWQVVCFLSEGGDMGISTKCTSTRSKTPPAIQFFEI